MAAVHGSVVNSVPASLDPVDGVYTQDVTIDAANDLWARVFIPTPPVSDGTSNDDASTEDKRQLPVIFYFHGGGFMAFSPDDTAYDPLSREIAYGCQAIVVSTNYRKTPDNPCPAAYDDCWKAIQWLRSPESRAQLPAAIDPSQCFLMGDSAGGNISHTMGCKAATAEDISPVQIQGIVEWQPFYGGEDITAAEAPNPPSLTLTLETTHEHWKAFVPWQNRDHPNINVPLSFSNGTDLSAVKLPPILVIIGGRDILRDRQARYAQKLQSMGKDVTVLTFDKADHGFYGVKQVDYGNQAPEAKQKAFEFVRSHVTAKNV